MEKVNDLSAARSQMLDLALNPPLQKLDLIHYEKASSKNQSFLTFFKEEIWPQSRTMETLIVKASALHTALDRALYNNEVEKKDWMSQKNAAENQFQKIRTNPDWQKKIKKFSDLSQGLTGDLPSFARRFWEDVELGEFTEKELPKLNRLTEISTQISNISNTSEFVPKLAAAEKQVNDLRKDFFLGKLGFTETWQGIEAEQKNGRAAHGQDVAIKAGALLNEAAILRTELAKSKKFRNWAEYEMAQQARHYSRDFKTADSRIAFLKKLLSVGEAPYKKFLKKRFSQIKGADENNFRRSQLGLLSLEEDTLIRDYFPKEKIEDVWKQTMLDAGFSEQKLSTIYLDGFPRENKYTHAYMNCVFDHKPNILTIDGESLTVRISQDSPANWFSAQIYIVQNYRDDGPHAWTTAFHEGGHALDYSYREDLLDYGAAYGYVETHSMMMERFFEDAVYLKAIGKTKEGKTLTDEMIRQYINHVKVNSLMENRRQIANALFDIVVWNYEYTKNSESFVDRAAKLFGDLQYEASLAEGHTIDGIDWRLNLFTTDHFYSASVRYFGYIVADMAAQLSADALWDDFEKKSGKRSFYKQNTMARRLIDGYYKTGFLTEFPLSIEKFTGRSFSPEAYMQSTVEAVEEFVSS